MKNYLKQDTFYQRHIWQSVTCRVYFWVTHCTYLALSIFAGGNSNRKDPHPHEHTAWYASHSASTLTRNTQLPESQKPQGRQWSLHQGSRELPASSIFQHFCLRSEKTWRACPCCLHSWVHGKDCLIWNMTWAMRLQGEMSERIQVGGREEGGGEGE